MFKPFVLPFVVAALVGSAIQSQAQGVQWNKTEIESIYRDPMFVCAKGAGKLIHKSDERYPFRRGGFAHKIEYRLVVGQKDVGESSLYLYPGGATSVLISAVSDAPAPAVDAKANWNTLTKNWDAFVARHWPDVHFRRTEDPGKSAFPKTSSGFYNLSVSYCAVQQGIEVASLQLSVQPADGKISMVDCSDDRELLRDFAVPPPISLFQLVKAMLV